MSKSTAIIFIMGFALFFKLEKKVFLVNFYVLNLGFNLFSFIIYIFQHWTLLVVVVMISGGLVMFTYQVILSLQIQLGLVF